MMRSRCVLFLLLACPPPVAGAQRWNDDATRTLVARAVVRRTASQAGDLHDFRARAHGFVFFLAQLGDEGFAEPPRLIKSDQLELEVYWNADGASKQRIVGWRNRVDLPTDIQYHRDHLGIVQNGFADRIRLGEGDEVRDVPHPLAPEAAALYDYAVVDSVTIGLPGREVRTVEVAFRPRDYGEPRVVGSMYLDAHGGELVQLRFNFTRSAYLDASLEDITILLENGLWEGRWWLPRRQEIEIRRRTTWLDLPARGIIRGRWLIDGYAFNVGLPPRTFRGLEIVAAPRAERDTFPWVESLDAAIRDAAGPATPVEMDEVRARVRDITGGRLLTGLAATGLAFGSVSDILHFNRVEGFAPGIGIAFRPGDGATIVHLWTSYGAADRRLKARLRAEYRLEDVTLVAHGARVVRDAGDRRVISPLLNSVLAQEGGHDFGDYALVEEVGVGVVRRPVELWIGVERASDVRVRTAPAAGSFRSNPPLGSGTWATATARLSGTHRAAGGGRALRGEVHVSAGARRDRRYVRARASGAVTQPVGAAEFALDAWGGWASADLPAHRPFLLGGRGSLVGEGYRTWGGRRAAWARLALRAPVPFPAVPLGPFASTGRQLVVGPYVAAGWAGHEFSLSPWRESPGIRPVVGVGLDAVHGLVRLETGWSVRDGNVGITVDLRSDLWPIL